MRDEALVAHPLAAAPMRVQRCVTHHACDCRNWMADQYAAVAAGPELDVERLEKAMRVSLDIYGWDLDVMAREIAAEYARLADEPAA